MGCQAGWPLDPKSIKYATHLVQGGYANERVSCTKDRYAKAEVAKASSSYLDTIVPDIANSIATFVSDIAQIQCSADVTNIADYIAQRLEPLRKLIGTSWELKDTLEKILMDGRTLRRDG